MLSVEQGEKKLYILDSGRIDYYWKNVEKLLSEVPMFYEFYTPEWLYEQAKTGQLQIWALSDGVIKGIVVTQICCFPKANMLQILAAAGVGMLKFIDEGNAMFDWIAKENNCSFVQAICRPGLVKKLKSAGVVQGVILTRAVQAERIQ